MQKTFEHIFSRRGTALFIAILLLMLVCILRIYVLCSDAITANGNQSNTVSLTVGELRGNIFDANMVSLTGNKITQMAAITNSAQDMMALTQILKGQELQEAIERLSEGKPILIETNNKSSSAVTVARVEHSSDNMLAKHIVGYVGASGHGVSGIEAACDSMLYTGEKLKLVYSVDGHGQLLSGIKPQLVGDTSIYGDGVALTLDSRIQSVAENAMQSIKRGAAVVFEVKSGKIRAMVSRPDYDPTNISQSLESEDSPLINRALYAYNVGSVFKPCIAAAAIEQGTYLNLHYSCTGSSEVGGRIFNCNSAEGHGYIDLKQALTFSCNTFFYELAQRCGANAIYNMARQFNFGNAVSLADGITTQSGGLTSLKDLSASNATVANFAIGQGDILLSPVAVGYMYCAIAGDGTYSVYPLVEGQVKNYKLATPKKQVNSTRVMSEQTAKILREYLINAVNNGTGKLALPKSCTAGGKTATAQTGWLDEYGNSVTQGWFCGFFPAENPQYIAVILAEDVASGGSVCAPVFSDLADGICALNLS